MATAAMNEDACFLFRGDIRYDTRLRNIVHAFARMGNRCRVIQGAGEDADFETADARVESFACARSGPLGFVRYWRRSARHAAAIHARVWWAADLYSLPLAVRRARANGGHAVYDAREIFAHLGSLRARPLTQAFWRMLERRHIQRAQLVVATGDLDARFLAERYRITPPLVLRNLPQYQTPKPNRRLHQMLGLPEDTPIALYTGGLQEGRGIELMLAMAAQLPAAAFVFLGNGPLESRIRDTARTCPNVHHLNAVANEQVVEYTAGAAIGLALIEPISFSYRLALPNKLFEYIMAGIPVVVTDLPQMRDIVDEHKVGLVVPPGALSEAVAAARRLLTDAAFHAQCAANARAAARVLSWDREEEKFIAAARAAGLM
ncbi:MAG TPA: glycosyltransferase [bacterium]|nr:glycosyltransferase [bacterium]